MHSRTEYLKFQNTYYRAQLGRFVLSQSAASGVSDQLEELLETDCVRGKRPEDLALIKLALESLKDIRNDRWRTLNKGDAYVVLDETLISGLIALLEDLELKYLTGKVTNCDANDRNHQERTDTLFNLATAFKLRILQTNYWPYAKKFVSSTSGVIAFTSSKSTKDSRKEDSVQFANASEKKSVRPRSYSELFSSPSTGNNLCSEDSSEGSFVVPMRTRSMSEEKLSSQPFDDFVVITASEIPVITSLPESETDSTSLNHELADCDKNDFEIVDKGRVEVPHDHNACEPQTSNGDADNKTGYCRVS